MKMGDSGWWLGRTPTPSTGVPSLDLYICCHFHIPIISYILADANEQFQVPKHEGRIAGDMVGGCSGQGTVGGPSVLYSV